MGIGRMVGSTILEEGQSNFGRVVETEENLVDQGIREYNPIKLKRGFGGVKRVVVQENDLGYQICVF